MPHFPLRFRLFLIGIIGSTVALGSSHCKRDKDKSRISSAAAEDGDYAPQSLELGECAEGSGL